MGDGGCGESVDLRGGGGKNVIMCLVFAIKNGARSTIRLEIYICVLSSPCFRQQWWYQDSCYVVFFW